MALRVQRAVWAGLVLRKRARVDGCVSVRSVCALMRVGVAVPGAAGAALRKCPCFHADPSEKLTSRRQRRGLWRDASLP